MTAVQYRSMMSPSDAIIWNIERDPHLRSTVMSVWMLDEAPAADRMAVNLDRMVAAIPRLRQRVVEGRPRPTWEPAVVDLDRHYECHALPPGSTWRDVLDLSERWVREPFDRTRPLWKLGLVTGLEGGKAAVVIKVHHAIADGMGMVLMLAAFTDLERNPPLQPIVDAVEDDLDERMVFSAIERLRHRTRTLMSDLRRAVRTPFDSVRDLVRLLRSTIRLVTPHRTPHSPLMTERSELLHMDSRILDLEAMRDASKARGESLNDLFVAVIVEAAARYHQRLGRPAERLRLHMPVDARNNRTASLAGNQFVPARVSLDVAAPSAAIQLDTVRRQLERLRSEPALHHVNPVSAAIQQLGKPISRWIVGGMMKGVDILASNVPGPPFPLYLAGSKVVQFFGFGPPAGAAMNATLFSYDRRVWLGLTTDGAAVTDRALFLECLDEVIAAAIPHRPTETLAPAS